MLPESICRTRGTFFQPQNSMMKKSILLLPALLPAVLSAQSLPIDPNRPERDFREYQAQPDEFNVNRPRILPKEEIAPRTQVPGGDGGTLHLSIEELAARPELLERALDASLAAGNAETVRFLLPYYKALPEKQKDPVLVLYADAFLAQADQNLDRAIRKYRQIIAERPDLTPMRLNLAVALFENREDVAARDQFERIRSEEGLPEQVVQLSNQYLLVLQKRNSWTFDAGFQYLSDNNINNAPKETQHGPWKTSPPESAHGIGWNFAVGKSFPLPRGWSVRGELDGYGKNYWDNHKYDEITARLTAGVAYKNLRSEFALLPYFEKQWYGGEQYRDMPGLRLESSFWLHPRVQLLGAVEYGRKQQKKYQYLDGNSWLGSASVFLLASPRTYFVLGTDISKEDAKSKEDAYRRMGLRATWGQEWGLGLSTSLSISRARRKYEEKYFPIDSPRQEYENYYSASVWLRNVYLMGITPRLTFAHQKYSSNHFIYNYQKNRLYLELRKRF